MPQQVIPPPPPPPKKGVNSTIPPPPPGKPLPPTPQEAKILGEFNPWVKQRQAELEASAPKLYTQKEVDDYNTKINQQFQQEQEQKFAEISKKYTLPLPTTQEPAGQPALDERSIFGVLPIIGDAIHYGGKAVERGFYQGQQAEIINPYNTEGSINRTDIEDLSRYQQEINSRQPSPYFKKATEADSFLGSLSAFAERPLTTMAELIGQSMSAMATHGATRIAGGAAIGAGVGLTGLGVGAVPGAATGALAAVPDVSLNLEYSGKILQTLSESGVDTTNPEQIIQAFSDPVKVSELRNNAFKKAVPIAIFDALSAGIAGKFLKGAITKGGSKLAAGGKELAVQMGTGGAGELSGELVSGEKISPGAILSEMVGEIGGGAIETAVGASQVDNITDNVLDPVLKETVDSEANSVVANIIDQTNAVQKPSTEGVDVRQQAPLSEKVSEVNTEEPTVTKESKVEDPQLTSLKEEYKKATDAFFADPTDPELADKVKKLHQQIKDTEIEKSTAKEPFQDQIKILNDKKGVVDDEFTNAARIVIDSIQNEDQRQNAVKLFNIAIRTQNKNDVSNFVKALEESKGLKTTTIRETTLTKKLRDAWRQGITLGRKDEKAARVGLITNIKELLKESDLPKRTYKAIINKIGSVNLKNEESIRKVQDYVEKVVGDAKVAEQFDVIENLQESVRKFIGKLPNSQKKYVRQLVNADPVKIKDLPAYIKLMTDISRNISGVKAEKVKVTEDNFEDLKAQYPELEQSDIGHSVVVDVAEPGPAVEEGRIKEGYKTVTKDTEDYKSQQNIDYLESEDFGDLDQEIRDVINDKKSLTEVKESNRKKIIDAVIEMISNRINKATPPKGETQSRTYNDIKNNLKNLDKLPIDELKTLLRGVDQGLVNGIWVDAFGPSTHLAAIDALSKIPKMDITKGRGKWKYTYMNSALFLEDIYNSFKDKIAKFRANSGWGSFVVGKAKSLFSNNKYSKEVNDILKKIEKKYNLSRGNIDKPRQVMLRQILAEYMVEYSEVETTDQEGIDRANANLETELRSMLAKHPDTGEYVYPFAEIAQDVFGKFLSQDFKTKQEVIDFAKSIDPASTEYTLKLIEFYNRPEIREKALELSKVQGDNTFREDMKNVLPIRFKGAVEPSVDDVVAKHRAGANINIPDASSIKYRNRVWKEGTYRRIDQTAVLIETLFAINNKYHTEYGTRVLLNLLKEDTKNNYKLTGSEDAHNVLETYFTEMMLSHRNGTLNEGVQKALNKIINITTTGLLTGPSKLALQYFPMMVNSLLRLATSGKDPSLAFGNGEGSETFLEGTPVGMRLEQMAGLALGTDIDSTSKRAMKSINDKDNALIEAGRTGVDLVDQASSFLKKYMFGAAEAFGAKQIFLGNYLNNLKSNGVDVSKRNTPEFWQNEKQLLESGDPIRNEAFQAADQEVSTVALPSMNAEKSIATKNPDSNIMRIVFPLLRYQLAFKIRLMQNIGNMATGKNKAEGARGLAGNTLEAATYISSLTFLIAPLLDKAASEVAEMFGFSLPEDDEEDKKKKKERKFATGVINELTPLPLIGGTQELMYPLYNELAYRLTKEEGQTFEEWTDDGLKGLPWNTYDKTFMESLGLISTEYKNIDEFIEAYRLDEENNVLVADTGYGEKKIELSDEQLAYFKLRMYIKGLQLLGLTPADVRAVDDRIYRGIIKGSSSTGGSSVPAFSPGMSSPAMFPPPNLIQPRFTPPNLQRK